MNALSQHVRDFSIDILPVNEDGRILLASLVIMLISTILTPLISLKPWPYWRHER